MCWFQSSPVPKDGCNNPSHLSVCESCLFQSSPVPKDGCNMSCTSLISLKFRFQSSPVPKDGCNWGILGATPQAIASFNPHPSRRTGATAFGIRISHDVGVSILTRPEGRVQHGGYCAMRWRKCVSILTRPEGRVQRRTTALNSTQLSSFSAKQRR